jgi:YD repeat-containing protein
MPTRPSTRPAHRLAARPWGALAAAALAALLALPAASAQTTSETLDLIGPVAAVEEYRWFPDTTERELFRTWAFDEAGVAIERVIFVYDWRDGSLRERRVTLFDAGQPLATVAYDADDEPTGQTVFRYDGEGRLVEEVTVDGEGVETRRIAYEHDAAGNVVRVAQYRGGALDRTVERDHDADGARLEERRFDGEGRLNQVSRYTVPGLEHVYEQLDEEGEVEATGRVIEGAFGTVLIEVLAPDGTPVESYAWSYDDRGRVLERRSVYDGGEIEELLTYAYDDDDRGNWVRQTTHEDYGDGPELYEIHERVISYR